MGYRHELCMFMCVCVCVCVCVCACMCLCVRTYMCTYIQIPHCAHTTYINIQISDATCARANARSLARTHARTHTHTHTHQIPSSTKKPCREHKVRKPCTRPWKRPSNFRERDFSIKARAMTAMLMLMCTNQHSRPAIFLKTKVRARRDTYVYTHVHTHAHMHTCTHAHMHTCTHTHMHAHVHSYVHTHMHTCSHTHIHTCTLTYVQSVLSV